MSRLLLVGAGAIARHHATAVLASVPSADSELYVTDISAAALAAFCAEFPGSRPFATAEEMLAPPAEEGDMVVVATPPFTHHELVLRALRSGRPVLCEKPFALSVAEATEMARTARELRVPLACCDVRFLGLPATERAKQLLRAGDLGVPYHVSFVNKSRRARSGYDYQPGTAWFRDPALSGGGVLMDWGPYDVAVLNDVLDPVRFEVRSAWVASPLTEGVDQTDAVRAEQHAGAELRLERRDGAVVNVSYERAACTHGGERSVVEIEGSTGAVAWDWLDWVGEGRLTLTTDAGGEPVSAVEVLPPDGPGFNARPIERFRARLAAPDRAEPGTDALFNFRCLRAVHEAATTGLPTVVDKESA